MYNSKYIIIGIVFFVCALTFPFWYNALTKDTVYKGAEVSLPKDTAALVREIAVIKSVNPDTLSAQERKGFSQSELKAMADAYQAEITLVATYSKTECIEPAINMRTEHMTLLNKWRDEALRNGNRVYTASTGISWDVNLQNTCMQCHTNKEQFCDVCHDNNSVSPYCWDCHVEPKGSKR